MSKRWCRDEHCEIRGAHPPHRVEPRPTRTLTEQLGVVDDDHRRKLTADDIAEIVARRDAGDRNVDIAADYGISQAWASQVYAVAKPTRRRARTPTRLRIGDRCPQCDRRGWLAHPCVPCDLCLGVGTLTHRAVMLHRRRGSR